MKKNFIFSREISRLALTFATANFSYIFNLTILIDLLSFELFFRLFLSVEFRIYLSPDPFESLSVKQSLLVIHRVLSNLLVIWSFSVYNLVTLGYAIWDSISFSILKFKWSLVLATPNSVELFLTISLLVLRHLQHISSNLPDFEHFVDDGVLTS